MDYMLKFIQVTVEAALTVLEIAVFIRCIMSFFAPDNDSMFSKLIYTITEPFLAPIRARFDKIPAMANLPLDFSPIILVLLISIVLEFLTIMFSIT